MEENLISKKDLLELTGISYGQLYRWKRKQLIPEEWFIRKSTFTGQETFFPKDLILARIDRIVHMKDDLSLDELAGKLSPLPMDIRFTREELESRYIVSPMVLSRYMPANAARSQEEPLSFEQGLYLYVVDRLLQTGEMGLDEGALLLTTLQDHYMKFEGRKCELIFARKMGVSFFNLISVPGEWHYDSQVKVIARVPMSEWVEAFKMKLY
ncbi:YhbD family protein [Paenibacillus gansuensis]|uniref:YhbD family protein n=1 Tax=Paenibacillus gansuensis TaxID=306542 RepID=A0ABW5PHF0_9BACL